MRRMLLPVCRARHRVKLRGLREGPWHWTLVPHCNASKKVEIDEDGTRKADTFGGSMLELDTEGVRGNVGNRNRIKIE